MTARLGILLAAAGASRRMRGKDKLLEEVAGEALLARQARIALETGLPVLVTLPVGADQRHAALAHLPGLSIEELEDASKGMSASLRAGAAWAERQGFDGLIILLADMPEITADDIRTFVETFEPGKIYRATDALGRAGHPVLLPARLFPEIGALRGDQGAKTLLERERVIPIALPGSHATTDLDTPEEWSAWRARKTSG